MIYVFDSSSFIVIGHYFPDRFPTFWGSFNIAVNEAKVISVREVYNELNVQANRPHLLDWIESNKRIFLKPTPAETQFVREIFSVQHFQNLISEKQRLKGSPIADPFVIASAKIQNGIVITEETFKPNAAKIPNICRHFNIVCTNLEGFMEQEGWAF